MINISFNINIVFILPYFKKKHGLKSGILSNTTRLKNDKIKEGYKIKIHIKNISWFFG